jgi:hypothetical protein
MNEELGRFAEKAKSNAYFLAATLQIFAQSREFDDAKLCEYLQCDSQTLLNLRLCRTPRLDAEGFQRDIEQICQRFGVHSKMLAKMVREVQAILPFRESQVASNPEFLLAARDAPEPELPPEDKP